MARKKTWDDDDGRTIASMSDVQRPNLFIPRKNQRDSHMPAHPDAVNATDSFVPVEEEASENDRPWDQSDRFSKQERRCYALGALKAALLIGMAFIVGLGIAILAMILIWG